MRALTAELTTGDLPDEVAVFPLSGAVLLPHGRLPLNIFERRYRMMIEDVMADGRFMAMVQPRSARTETVADDGLMYDVGCLGRITAFTETDDGRFLITLFGLSRFRIIDECAMRNGYRRIGVDFSDFQDDLAGDPVAGFVRQPFIDTLHAYFASHDIKGSWDALEKADERTLITSVAMAVPFSPEERQAILECQSLAEQGELLRSLMEMAVHEKQVAITSARH